MLQSPRLHSAVVAVHYSIPALILLYYVLSSLLSAIYLQSSVLKERDKHVCRSIIVWLILALIGTYFAQAIEVFVYVLVEEGAEASQHENVYVIGSIIVWGIQFLSLLDKQFPVWYPYLGSWCLAISLEAPLSIVLNIDQRPETAFDTLRLIVHSIRFSILSIIIALFFNLRTRVDIYRDVDAESQALLEQEHHSVAPEDGYGTTITTKKAAKPAKAKKDDKAVAVEGEDDSEYEDNYGINSKEDEERMMKRLSNDGSWLTYMMGFRVFVPYLWPFHDRLLQLRALGVVIILLTINALHILLPRQFGILVNHLYEGSSSGVWVNLAIYAVLMFLSSGFLAHVKFWLWLPVEQYGEQALLVAAHTHVMNLSSDFHDSKESFQIYKAILDGQSITSLLGIVCFEVLPMLIDLFLASAYLYFLFGPYLAMCVFSVAVVYIYATTRLVTANTEARRISRALQRRRWNLGYRSIDGWVTASMFDNIEYDQTHFQDIATKNYKAEFTFGIARELVTVVQSSIMLVGLTMAGVIAVHGILYGTRTPGDFVTLLALWAQLRNPLSHFSRIYKQISNCMMDAERLWALFQSKPNIKDKQGARPLELKGGRVKFSNVTFRYDPCKTALQELSFDIPAGYTVALVGETGGGKSTILKLLNRFYDPQQGNLFIDGQNTRDVTLSSLRQAVGVVPQEPVMFNGTILSNVLYGRLGASIEDAHQACKAACIHDKIMSFPKGYGSRVGSRGVKLSGSEKQRIAIARAILKNPEIILLDEATSAIDTDTEHKIQDALERLCKNRTTFVVAHRLSTILNAHIIMVFKDGRIVESGGHEELIDRKNGKYADLWKKQITVRGPKAMFRGKQDRNDKILINDVDLERPTASLAKILATHGHSKDASRGSPHSLSPSRPDYIEVLPAGQQISIGEPAISGSSPPKKDLREPKSQKKISKEEQKKEKDEQKKDEIDDKNDKKRNVIVRAFSLGKNGKEGGKEAGKEVSNGNAAEGGKGVLLSSSQPATSATPSQILSIGGDGQIDASEDHGAGEESDMISASSESLSARTHIDWRQPQVLSRRHHSRSEPGLASEEVIDGGQQVGARIEPMGQFQNSRRSITTPNRLLVPQAVETLDGTNLNDVPCGEEGVD